MSSFLANSSGPRQLSDSRLAQLALESAVDFAVFTTNLDGIIISWNSAAERLMGWLEAEAVGQHATIIFTPADEAVRACQQEMAQARRSGRAVDERWHLRKDRSRFWGSGSMTRLEDDETGEHLGYLKIVRDRTAEHVAGERLQASEALLRSVMESNPDCLKLLSLDGHIVFMNSSGLALLGIEHFENIRGKDWVSLWPEEERHKVRAALSRATIGLPSRFQGWSATATDSIRWWDVQVTLLPESADQAPLLLTSSRDITDQVDTAEQLRANHSLFHSFAENSADVLWIVDAGMQHLEYLSPAYEQVWGEARDKIMQDLGHWAERVHPDDREQASKALPLLLKGEAQTSEYRIVRPNGEVRWIRDTGFPIRREDGAIFRVAGIANDVTVEKLAAQDMHETSERYRLAVRATNDAIWDWDLRHNRVEWNEALQHAYGYAPEDVGSGGEWWLEHIHPDDRERVYGSIQSVIKGTESHWSDEYRFRKADGSYADVLDRAFMVRDSRGEPSRIIGAMLDLTERRRAEAELRRLNEQLEVEVARRAEQLRHQEEMLRQSQKLEAVGQLTGGVAHDFNNLLTIIRSSVGLLQRPNLPPEKSQRYMQAISDTVDRAMRLTGQLLAFARRQPLQPEIFAADDRIRNLSQIVRTIVGGRVAVSIEDGRKNCYVQADPSQFETALVNLAVNARDAMDGEGRLTFKVKQTSSVPPTRGHAGAPGDFVAVSVSDTGSGISPEMLDRIFEPFFTTKEVGKGTGLGLSQVYGFAKQSGGRFRSRAKLVTAPRLRSTCRRLQRHPVTR
ncbi:PAS domain-containing sensor histidine kinase [Muricoccus nepalensis]|uniref:PAS domain-containing sensor histidine kinase n=1 Tax=Muricoccus nepalensis TaxID=1854500 RepID=UPI0019D576CA|nr:PAS domain S-box protein [Roseomonas nepalensis]